MGKVSFFMAAPTIQVGAFALGLALGLGVVPVLVGAGVVRLGLALPLAFVEAGVRCAFTRGVAETPAIEANASNGVYPQLVAALVVMGAARVVHAADVHGRRGGYVVCRTRGCSRSTRCAP